MSFTAEGYAANQASMRQAAGGAQLGVNYAQSASSPPSQTARVDQLLNMAGSLCEQAGILAQRIEQVDQRMFGSNVGGATDSAKAPTPVRSSIDELDHRLTVLAAQLQRGFDAINRLDRL